MRTSLLAFLLVSAFHLSAQTTQEVYGTPENEENFPMLRLPNGDFILAGNTKNPGFGLKDVLVTRLDSTGNVIWSKQYGGSGDETAITIAQTPDSGFVVGGETFSVDPDGDAFVFKVDASGALQWWKNYGGFLYDITYSVIALADGSIVSAGLIETAPVDYDAFLMKTDANGDTLWTKIIGASGIDHAVTVIQATDSGFVFVGKTLSVGQGSCDCWIVKTDANGDTLWTSVIGGQGWDESMDIIEQPGGYVICGGTNSEGNSNYDFFLMHIDFQGNLTWIKQYGGTNVEASYCVEEIPGDGYVIAGYTETYSYTNSRGNDSANAWIVKTGYAGDTLWTMVYGGDLKEECFSLATLPDGGVAFSGYTASFGDSTQTYLFITDTAGYTGCLERRTAPTVFSPAFVRGNFSFAVSSGYTVTAPLASQMINPVQHSTTCTGPMSTTGDVAATDVLIFPNPVCGKEFTVRSTQGIQSVGIYSIDGSAYGVEHVGAPVYEINITAPQIPGAYIAEITFGDNTVIRRELIVTR